MRLLLISTVALYREGLAEVLARRRGFEVAGATGDPAGASGRLADGCGIVLLDMVGFDPVDVARRVVGATQARVVAINVPSDPRDVIACVEAGVACCLTAEASLDQLVLAIAAAARGESLCSPWTAAVLQRRVAALARERRTPVPSTDPVRERLTAREFEIIELVELGLSNKEIALRLFIELPTVKNHIHRILDKLGVARRAEAAAMLRDGVIRGGLRPEKVLVPRDQGGRSD